MPIYEEKLVSPFAVRFTQDYIRTSFRDGRLVESALNEVKTEPGVGDYDLILRAPFPHIEIIRWRLPRYGVGRVKTGKGSNIETREHWFTLDNRRLYCLQRVAAALWPRRVAAVVEILYADPGTVWKKYDSSTHGWSVNLGTSTEVPTDRWDWRETILPLEINGGMDVETGVLATMLADDKKRKVGELLDTPDRPNSTAISVSELLARSGSTSKWGSGVVASSEARTASEQCPTPSTADASDESDSTNCEPVTLSESPKPSERIVDDHEADGPGDLESLAKKVTKEIEEACPASLAVG
mmetsp:Transcript_13189/g.30988  ORF Transcript_13189/g.30988 Transcript_13189/m.30988 type:complete len:298 (+) Transcript_13189:99-992(+)|eukprot:CAMPEP_0171101802 /NCGR_PEP_ID=MMETSP0766_2-20121228/56049_1 /TAXON_ID=439317 /ORGANISM="Gambierdiscus australes, Strain CAWD 149" /LENGTH=297 /DNA_ID=CAMNT_0011561941 /DNA_START=90 /DNA_END=983 /DNA_ORIENTATION=-